ncbi:MAG: class GN sortase [Congregibacter sp.]
MLPRKLSIVLAPLLAVLATVQFAGAALIYAKAWLAPVLLEAAYARGGTEGAAGKPWPWADTRPVARLQVAGLSIQRLVLEGDSGNTLAFGPGMAAGPSPGERGMVMISAHRDTHFRFLQNTLRGDELALEYHGQQYRYRVLETVIADARAGELRAPLPEQGLLLVTCYPFDAIIPGGPLRFVVIAEQISGGTTSL